MRTQVFCFGASFVYGVGGPKGGWADMLKRHIHEKQYTDKSDESVQVYNFARPGMMVKEIVASIETDIAPRRFTDQQAVVLISSGMNDAKSRNSPENFANSPEQFESELTELLQKAKQHTEKILYASGMYVDEARTAPKENPDGNKTYFINERVKAFNDVARKVCSDQSIIAVDFFAEMTAEEWLPYLCADGLHPNDTGYRWMFDRIQPEFEQLLQ